MKQTTNKAADEIISRISKLKEKSKTSLLIALDGRSGTGKSTLSKLVAEKTGGVVVVSDDFYSGGNDDKWEGYTPQAKTDEVIDWKRLRKEALEPLLSGKPAIWHPLDFEPGVGWIGWKDETVILEPSDIIILDGAYSTRPELSDIINLSVLIETPESVRRERLQKREGEEFMKRWHKLWDPAEDYYFTKVRPTDSFDLVINLT